MQPSKLVLLVATAFCASFAVVAGDTASAAACIDCDGKNCTAIEDRRGDGICDDGSMDYNFDCPEHSWDYLDCPDYELPICDLADVHVVGCFQDNSVRVFEKTVTLLSDEVSQTWCAGHCSLLGYDMAGVEYGQQCYCGNATDLQGVAERDMSACTLPCTGNGSEYCGGIYTLLVLNFSCVPPPPVDCEGAWAEWGECSESCGSGLRYQTFEVTQEPKFGGAECCPNPTHDCSFSHHQGCNTQHCPSNCHGEWSEWSECDASCGRGAKHKTFSITKVANHGGAACAAETGDLLSHFCDLEECLTTTTTTHAPTTKEPGFDYNNDTWCIFCNATTDEVVADTLTVVAATSLVTATVTGVSSGASAIAGSATAGLVAGLSHNAMLSKLDVMAVQSPDFVNVNSLFSVFNLQNLPVPWDTSTDGGADYEDVSVSSRWRRRRLQVDEAATADSNNTLDCYHVANTVRDVRKVQKLANIKSFTSKFAQFSSNIFYVVIFFACAAVLQLLFFVILRAVVRCRVRDYIRKRVKLQNFAMKVRNVNRVAGTGDVADLDSVIGPGRRAQQSHQQQQQVSNACQRTTKKCTMKAIESLFSLVLIRKSDDDIQERRIMSRKASFNSISAQAPELRDVLDNFILKDGESYKSLTVKGTVHIYMLLLLGVYQGVCESCAFVLALGSQDEDAEVVEFTASLITFLVVVVAGFIAVWAVLLAYVRPQRRALFDAHKEEWVGADKYAQLLQNTGGLFRSYRYAGGRYLFSAIWMLNLMTLAFILAFASGLFQIYLMIINEAWIGLLYFAWQPYRIVTPVFGGCGHINLNLVHGMERLIMVAVLSLAAFWPSTSCQPVPDYVTTTMIALSLVPSVLNSVFLIGNVIAWVKLKCIECQKRQVASKTAPATFGQVELRGLSPMSSVAVNGVQPGLEFGDDQIDGMVEEEEEEEEEADNSREARRARMHRVAAIHRAVRGFPAARGNNPRNLFKHHSSNQASSALPQGPSSRRIEERAPLPDDMVERMQHLRQSAMVVRTMQATTSSFASRGPHYDADEIGPVDSAADGLHATNSVEGSV